MGENLKEMNLDVGSDFASKTISDALTEVSGIVDFSKKSSKLDFHVHALEEEMRKIEAFKRELPNCMHLLKDAIERLKEESRREMGPVMEELVLFKNNSEENERAKVSNDFTEKQNWMSSVQLWSTPVHYENTRNQDSIFHLKSRCEEGEGSGRGTQFQGCNFRNRVGAFAPFKKLTMKEKQETAPDYGLSLPIPQAASEVEESNDLTVKGDFGLGRPKLQQPHQQEQQKKHRRCWSPELHKRFVDVLHHLGGAQTATPKQIRELMKVDGLTNDEVKSHLQKYRIHIKRLPTSSAGPSICGGWSKPRVAHSGSPQGPLQRGRPAKGSSAATGGESVDEEEDDRSDTNGWKGRLQTVERRM